jgi:hypothetical protein
MSILAHETEIPILATSVREKFWVEDFTVLLNNIRLLPTSNMSREEKLNVLTRLIIIATIVLVILKWQWWKEFAFISLLVVIIFNYNQIGCNVNTAPIREGFTVTPTFGPNDPALSQTYISPVFAEEWQVNPELRSSRTLQNGNKKMYPSSMLLDHKPRSYPYGQYLTKTNLLPSTEAQLSSASQSGRGMMNQTLGLTSAREFANSEFLRNDLAFRENMMTTYKRKLNRRFAQNTGYADNYVIGSPY